jgi:hydrophobe/amphiphile efflux-1 (HAE1) family protein
LVIVLAGTIGITLLPIEKLPQLAPTQISVTSVNIGADVKTTEDTVTTIIEREINGVENMKYMSSNTGSDGVSNITVAFPSNINRNTAQVNVQNRVSQAEPGLPEVVKQTGVTTEAASPNVLLAYAFYSDKDEQGNYLYPPEFVSNYIDLFIADEIKRIYGVGKITVFGELKYAMRIWLDPDRLAARGLTTNDVALALGEQNIQAGAGRIGQEPSPENQTYSIPLRSEGRFKSIEDAENLIIKVGEDGTLIKIKDVARVELGAETYDVAVNFKGMPAIGLGVYQLPGTNALDTANGIRAKMKELSASFPPGFKYDVAFDTTLFVETAIEDVTSNTIQAIIMTIITILIFLQDWRSTIVPSLAMPVAMIGSMIVLLALGYSVNLLTMFGIILAIGTVTDDAVVIVQAIKTKLNQGMRPRQAALDAMEELASPSITAALVQLAVFIPVCFFPGSTGIVYRQFAITLATAIVFSTFNALTFSPTIASLFFRPPNSPPDIIDKGLNFGLGWFFAIFNRIFAAIFAFYENLIALFVRIRYIVLAVFVAGLCATVFMYQSVPSGFIPEEDQGYFFILGEAPPNVSLQYTNEQVEQVNKILDQYPEVQGYLGLSGLSFEGNNYNKYLFFVNLKNWSERPKEEQSVFAMLRTINQRLRSEVTGSRAFAVNAPPVDGLSTTGGFEFQLQNRAGLPNELLVETAEKFLAEANKRPELQNVFTTFTTNTPQMSISVDRNLAKAMNVDVNEVFNTLQSYLGSSYINDFILGKRQYRVYIQAERDLRDNPEDITRFYVRSRNGNLVQMGNLVRIEPFTAPPSITHYNIYESIKIQGAPAAGYSTGQAIVAMEEVAGQVLPQGFGYEWTGSALEEKAAGGATIVILGLSFVLVFLIMAAQYESYIDPLIIMLTVPLSTLGALLAIWFRANLLQLGSIWPVISNDIYAQVGILMLIGMSSKNAILIVEQANELRELGMSLKDAAITAAKQRFQPIVMTAASGLVGYVPLMSAMGAGAISRWSIGTVSFGGYLIATILSLGVAPVLYILIKNFERVVLLGERATATE